MQTKKRQRKTHRCGKEKHRPEKSVLCAKQWHIKRERESANEKS